MICAVALVLLVDVSGSVSTENHRLQRAGIAAALREPAMARIVESQPPLALTVIEWDSAQAVVLPWQRLASRADLHQAAARLDAESAPPRAGSHGSTHVGAALAAAIEVLAQPPCAPERQVIDVSGDGASNGGPDPAEVRDRAAALGITVNGLPIVTSSEPTIADWYARNVVTEDGFLLAAAGFPDVARALRRKLVLEVAGL